MVISEASFCAAGALVIIGHYVEIFIHIIYFSSNWRRHPADRVQVLVTLCIRTLQLFLQRMGEPYKHSRFVKLPWVVFWRLSPGKESRRDDGSRIGYPPRNTKGRLFSDLLISSVFVMLSVEFMIPIQGISSC